MTSIIRLKSLTIAADSPDPTRKLHLSVGSNSTVVSHIVGDNAAIGMWSSIEMNMGIICACLPPLRPLVTRMFPLLMPSISRSKEKQSTDRQQQIYFPHVPVDPYGKECSATVSRQSPEQSRDRGITVTHEWRLDSSHNGIWEEAESERGISLRNFS